MRESSDVGSSSYVGVLDAVLVHSVTNPGRMALVHDDGGGPINTRTYLQLSQEVLRKAAAMRRAGWSGGRVALLFGPGIEVAIAVLSCFAAAAIAVPVAPVGRRRSRMANLQTLLDDCTPTGLIFDDQARRQYGDELEEIASQCEAQPIAWDRLGEMGEPEPPSQTGPLDLAVVQYTSGSTSTPKGVMITHGNIAANQRMIRDAFRLDDRSNFVGWAPHYHDQGLFGNILQPLFNGATCVLAAPTAFIRRPLTWLELISRHRAQVSGGPDFAYALCSSHAARRGLPDVDLSSWTVAFNGAEPIRQATMAAFGKTFAARGFREAAFLPCYGLAECTLLATGRRSAELPTVSTRARDPSDGGTIGAVCCGPPVALCNVVIADSSGNELSEGEEGEIWLAGPHVAIGYLNKPSATAETFEAWTADGRGPFLRTGDLGYMTADGLYVCGRIKDILIVRGRNFYPSDLEQVWDEIGGGPGRRCAAVQIEGAERSHVVLVGEIERRVDEHDPSAVELLEQLQTNAFARLEIGVSDLLLVPIGSIPLTTSGKVKRSELRAMLSKGALDHLSGAGPLHERKGLDVRAAEFVGSESKPTG